MVILSNFYRGAPLFAATSLTRRLHETVTEWLNRVRSRNELASLSAADIKDLGFPAILEAEKSKPFWAP